MLIYFTIRTIIHDLNENEFNKRFDNLNDYIINSKKCKHNCIGCFSCWIKHPKKCMINDNYSNLVDCISKSTELIIISRCRYGCYDSDVKKVLERCIGYVLPYFTIRNDEIHHESRYNKSLKFIVYLYGDVSREDKKCIDILVKANAINLNANQYEVKYFEKAKELVKCIH